MKVRAFVLLACFVLHAGFAQGTFQNLGFESAVIIPPGTNTHLIDFASAFPGWAAYRFNQVLTQQVGSAFYGDLALSSAQITLLDRDLPYASRIAGNYTAVLQAGDLGLTGKAATWLSQSGLVPAGTMSLRFLASGNTPSLDVLMNGQPLNAFPLQTFGGYTEYGADISSFANQSAELRFVERYPGNLFLDNISFSPIAVPEPSTWALLALGSAFFWFAARRRRR